MGSGSRYTAQTVALRPKQANRINNTTKYSGMEAVTESYTIEENGIKIIKTRTRYRKRRKNRK